VAAKRSWLAVVLLCLTASAPASASDPVPGGRYEGRARVDQRVWVHVKLTLANDGKELAARSWVVVDRDCGSGLTVTDLTELDRFGDWSRSVRIGPRGRFTEGDRRSRIRGRFARRG
jgi:hypothetical protein